MKTILGNGDSRSAKSAILTHLPTDSEFCFLCILGFALFAAKIYHIIKIQSLPEMAKAAVLELLDSPKLISRKI